MKITFEGSLAEFKAVFRNVAGGAGIPMIQGDPIIMSEVKKEAERRRTVVEQEQPAWEHPKDTHFPNNLGGPSGAHSFNEPAEAGEWGALPAALSSVDLPSIEQGVKRDAWQMFRDTVRKWLVGFEVEGAEQPDRVALMRDIGSGRWAIPILVMAFEIGSLQRLVQSALRELKDDRSEDLDFIERLAAHMIPICHAGFPDLAGTLDFSSRWRRIEPTWRSP